VSLKQRSKTAETAASASFCDRESVLQDGKFERDDQCRIIERNQVQVNIGNL
jgi:hypothetical protein